MVVDDDVNMTALARQLLEGDGYEVVDHQRWEDAHSIIRRQRIDLVLLDLRFEPGEMGWRVIDKLRVDAYTHRTPIILWSSAVEVLEARGPALLADDQFLLAQLHDADGNWQKARDILRLLTGPGKSPAYLTYYAQALLRRKDLTGKVAEIALDKAGISCSRSTIPFDTRKALDPSGIRLGSPAPFNGLRRID